MARSIMSSGGGAEEFATTRPVNFAGFEDWNKVKAKVKASEAPVQPNYRDYRRTRGNISKGGKGKAGRINS